MLFPFFGHNPNRSTLGGLFRKLVPLWAAACLILAQALPALAQEAQNQGQPPSGYGSGRWLNGIIIMVIVFALLRILRRRGGGRGPMGRPGSPPHQDAEKETHRQAADRYSRAQAAWDHLDGGAKKEEESADQSIPGQPEGFDQEEFLEGAKAIYARLTRALDERDEEDVRQFATESGLQDLTTSVNMESEPDHTEIMLLDARLMSMEEKGGDQEATVFYEAMQRSSGQDQPGQVRKVWRFVRPKDDPGAHWKLDGVESVN